MKVRRGQALALAVAAASGSLVFMAPPALADGSLFGQTCCDPGGAKVTAYANFISRYHVRVEDIKLTDLCPADGHSVYVQFQYQQSSGDWVVRGDNRENHASCDAGATSETPYDFTATSGRINAVRLKVCVDETWPNADDCQYTNYRYNQYD
ncbi:hypothetical protein [Jatrophihabitans sp.]|jgi:hypothetical protein|uniref:hypothetical protein n=1 Tax=Jatrophihabitans sp. TaxID=1932789 RepID=UPI002EEF85F9